MTERGEPNSLRSLGWTAAEEEQRSHYPACRFARVARVDGSQCQALTPNGPQVAIVPRSLSRDRASRPAVGDWVALEEDGTVVVGVLERRTCIVRAKAGGGVEPQLIAANVDRVFVLMGLDGDYNVRRLERYFALCADAEVEVIALLTKAGDDPDVQRHLAECEAVGRAAGIVATHAIDVVAGINTDVPAQYIEPATTIALLGSSGAGKSTLTNYLLGREHMATGSVREDDSRGRHTTTYRELIQLPSGGILIDNPGMRELALWLDGDGLNRAFDDVTRWAAQCRFNDCQHRGEPGCAVEEAIATGDLDARRFDSFRRLAKEAAVLERRRDAQRQRSHQREQSKLYRQVQKKKRGRR